MPEVLIVGAGVTGASVAYHLAARGCTDILVIDRADAPGGGSTSRATGGFRAQFGSEINVRLSLLSREKLLRFEDEIGVDPGYRPHGYLFLARNESTLAALRRAQAVQHACGLREAAMIGADEARKLNDAIHDDSLAGAAWCPTDGFLRPMAILEGYIAAATRLGVTFRFGTTERVDARIVVNAMGAWAGPPVVPLRRNVAATEPTDLLRDDMPMTIWVEDGYHLRVRDRQVLLLWPDDPPLGDDEWLSRVRAFTRERVPRIAELPIERTWSGFYEMSPDHHAIVGRDPHHENVYLATGSSGHGVMHAPAIGQLLAEIILDGEATTLDARPLRPSRFEEGALVEGTALL